MATLINVNNGSMNVELRINDDYSVELTDFSINKFSKPIASPKGKNPDGDQDMFARGGASLMEVHIIGESTINMHAYKHNFTASSRDLKYVGREEYVNNFGKKLEITMESANGLQAVYHMQFFHDLNVVRTWAVLTNVGQEDLGIEYVSSFVYCGIAKNGEKPFYEKTDVYIPYNSWCCEAQWQKRDIEEIGLSRMNIDGYNNPGYGNNRFHYGSTGSWSSCEYLPMGFARDRETGEIYFWEIEHSGAWNAEYGTTEGRRIYVALSGPTEQEDSWFKNLKPGMSFTTVPAAFGVVEGDETEATAEITKYRRVIRRPNQDDEKLNVVFNDYMNCLFGDPTEDNQIPTIDKAAALGCEYYCMDCGWYDKGIWWDKVGEWIESPERFPHGLKRIYDYARSKGLKMGMWLEIEVMGVACELSQKLPDDWFFCRHGKRHIDNKRYLLDFRNPEVRKYCRDVIDRLIRDYGCEFFKVDYNVTTYTGSDINSDSFGDAMLEHYRCLYDWWKDIYETYPNLVVEACSSGAQRMDYGILSLASLQSTSDQTDYIYNSYIAANVATAVTPEQGGMWVYPYVDEAEHVIYNCVNGMLLRPYVSGLVWNMSQENLDLLAEGIAVYKDIRNDLKQSTPFFPLGLGYIKDDALAYGVQSIKTAYLSVFGVRTTEVKIPLDKVKKPVKSVKVLYPKAVNCEFELKDNVLTVKLPQEKCARFFQLEY